MQENKCSKKKMQNMNGKRQFLFILTILFKKLKVVDFRKTKNRRKKELKIIFERKNS